MQDAGTGEMAVLCRDGRNGRAMQGRKCFGVYASAAPRDFKWFKRHLPFAFDIKLVIGDDHPSFFTSTTHNNRSPATWLPLTIPQSSLVCIPSP